MMGAGNGQEIGLSQGGEEDVCGCFGIQGGVFHKCHPDPKETNTIQYEELQDRSCWLRIPRLNIRLNPIVTILTTVIIWAFEAWSILDAPGALSVFQYWRTKIAWQFTWFYIGARDVWVLFLLFLYFSKYSTVKLGKDDDVPQFNNAIWFAMIFAGGTANDILYFSVVEPIWNYDKSGGGNKFVADSCMPDNTLAQWALTTTLYHWGFHGWCSYCVVGLVMGVVSHCLGLPMTVKFCFYPLLGDKIYGWVGDIIDVVAIIAGIFGVCAGLGVGALQLNSGFHMFNHDIVINRSNQLIIIWVVTAIATTSTMTGITIGIRFLSVIAFSGGVLIILIVLFLSNTWYLLNLNVQSFGFYMQWIIQTGFRTCAFEQLGPSYGGVSRGREFPDGTSDGTSDWMDLYTIFIFGWWSSSSVFSGMFIAKVSKGRTIGAVINCTMIAAVVYVISFFTIIAGRGIEMERAAAGIGLCCDANFNETDNASWFLPNETFIDWLCDNHQCNPCAETNLILDSVLYRNDTTGLASRLHEPLFGISLPNRSLTRLSCRSSSDMWFDIMKSYGDLGSFLSVISIIVVILYFVTFSDSCSLMLDCMAANGEKEPPPVQRLFWALTEGAVTTALLWAGGTDGLAALETVTVVSGFPVTISICFMCLALWRALCVHGGDMDPYGPQFAGGMFDVIARPTWKSVQAVLLNIFLAPYLFARAIIHTSNREGLYLRQKCELVFYIIVLYILLIGFVIFQIAVIWIDEIWALSWVCYLAFSCIGGGARIAMRNMYGISGNAVEDLFCGIFMYPFLAYQLTQTMDFYTKQQEESSNNTGFSGECSFEHTTKL